MSAPEPYLNPLKRQHGIGERVDMHSVCENGDEVGLWHDLVTNTPAVTARIAEHPHVESGGIRSIEVLFEPRPFAPMFAKGP